MESNGTIIIFSIFLNLDFQRTEHELFHLLQIKNTGFAIREFHWDTCQILESIHIKELIVIPAATLCCDDIIEHG